MDFALTNIYGPTGTLLRARLYTANGATVTDLALTESGHTGVFSGTVAISPDLADSADADDWYEYEVRVVSTQSGAAFTASTTTIISRGLYGWVVNGDWSAGTPRQIARVAIRDISLVQHGTESYVWTITDADGGPINLTGKTLRLVMYTADGVSITGVAQYESPAGLTIGSDDGNEVTRTFSTTDSGTARVMRYDLWNQTDGIPLARGKIDVSPALRTYP